MLKGVFDYIRRTYGVPAKRGGRVKFTDEAIDKFAGKVGRITSVQGGTGWLRVKVQVCGREETAIVHPLEVEYLDGESEKNSHRGRD